MQFPTVLKTVRAKLAAALKNGSAKTPGQLATRLSVDLYRTG